MLIHDDHGRLRLRGEGGAFCNDHRVRIICQNMILIIFDIGVSLFDRCEQEVKFRIEMFPVVLAKHLTAVIVQFFIRCLCCEGPFHTVFRTVREVLRIGELLVDDGLNGHILSCINTKSARIERLIGLRFGVTLIFLKIRYDLACELVDKVGINRIGIILGCLSILDAVVDRVSESLVIILLCDITLIEHIVQDFHTSFTVIIRMPYGIIPARILSDARNDGSFREGQLLDVFLEVLSGGCLHAVCAGTEVDRVQVILKDTVLGSFFRSEIPGELFFELHGQDLLLEFSLDTVDQSRFFGPGRKDVVLKQLLGDCTRSLRELEAVSYSDVQSSDNTLGVDTVVLIKTLIFDCYNTFLEVFRNIIKSDGNAVRIGCDQFLELVPF